MYELMCSVDIEKCDSAEKNPGTFSCLFSGHPDPFFLGQSYFTYGKQKSGAKGKVSRARRTKKRSNQKKTNFFSS